MIEYNINTDKRIRITETKGNEWDPFYSKNGNSILYASEYGIFDGISEIQIKN